MLLTIPANHQSPGEWADAGLLHGVATEAVRRCPRAVSEYSLKRMAPHSPSRTSLAPSNLVHELRQTCIDTIGPAGTFDIFANCFLGRSYPLLLPLIFAPDASSLLRRLRAVENLTPRVATTTLTGNGDYWIDIRQVRNDMDIAATTSYGVGYWGMIVGIFRAAGYKGLKLYSNDGVAITVIYNDDAFCIESLKALPRTQEARLTWRTRTQPSSPALSIVSPLVDSPMVDRIADIMCCALDAGSPVPSLTEIAKMTYCSTRSVQRRLTSVWITLRDISLSARIHRATLMLSGCDDWSLTDIACDSGFSDAPHFAREFKRVAGLTPENYRTMYRL